MESIKKEKNDSEDEEKLPTPVSEEKETTDDKKASSLDMDIDPHHKDLQEQAKLFSKVNVTEDTNTQNAVAERNIDFCY